MVTIKNEAAKIVERHLLSYLHSGNHWKSWIEYSRSRPVQDELKAIKQSNPQLYQSVLAEFKKSGHNIYVIPVLDGFPPGYSPKDLAMIVDDEITRNGLWGAVWGKINLQWSAGIDRNRTKPYLRIESGRGGSGYHLSYTLYLHISQDHLEKIDEFIGKELDPQIEGELRALISENVGENKWKLNEFMFDEFIEELSDPSSVFLRGGRLMINALYYTDSRGKPFSRSSKRFMYKHGKHVRLEYENGRGKIVERIDPVESFGEKQTRKLTQLGEMVTTTAIEKSLFIEFRI